MSLLSERYESSDEKEIIKRCAIKHDLTDDDLKYMQNRIEAEKKSVSQKEFEAWYFSEREKEKAKFKVIELLSKEQKAKMEQKLLGRIAKRKEMYRVVKKTKRITRISKVDWKMLNERLLELKSE